MRAIPMSKNRERMLKVLLEAKTPLKNVEIAERSGVSKCCASELVKRLEFLGWAEFDNDQPRRSGNIRRVSLAPFARQYVELLLPDPEEEPEA